MPRIRERRIGFPNSHIAPVHLNRTYIVCPAEGTRNDVYRTNRKTAAPWLFCGHLDCYGAAQQQEATHDWATDAQYEQHLDTEPYDDRGARQPWPRHSQQLRRDDERHWLTACSLG